MENFNSNIKILYVEDEKEISNLIKGVLVPVFKEVYTASNGEEALELFVKHGDFDIIITDISMPVMTGTELIQKVREIVSDFPVVVTTAYSDNKVLLELIESGISAFVTKPVDTKKLVQTISNTVEAKLLRRELRNVNHNLANDLKRTSFELNIILNTQESLIVILNNNEFYLANEQFLNYFGKKSINHLKSHTTLLSDLFIDSHSLTNNNFDDLASLLEINHSKMVVKMKNENNVINSFKLSIRTYQYDGLKYILTLSDITKLKVENDILEYKAHHDSLTKLHNREFFNEALNIETIRSKRYKNPFCVAMLDIDFFKLVNDTYGHDVGDEVLISLAATIKHFLREADIISRWGGEEFIVLLPETIAKNAFIKLDRLRVLIKNKVLNDKLKDPITISCGICQFLEEDTLISIFKRVDTALYKAKETGRDKVILG